MPRIVAYDSVVAGMSDQRMHCLYYNSGAFGFAADAPTQFAGWIGAHDPTIRPEALARAKMVADPAEATLVALVMRAWNELVPGGPVWVMPKSSWAYELDFGSKVWLPDVLRKASIDPSVLEGHTNAPAIEFAPDEADRFSPLLHALLQNLLGSDFALAFPGHPIACTVHHHKQIWWISSDASFISRIANLA